MATHRTELPNLARQEASSRRRRARLDNQISTLLWRMDNDENIDLAYLQQQVDQKTLQVIDLTAAIACHDDAVERRELRKQLLAPKV